MAYDCSKCFHNFNCSLSSVASCNCCEDGDMFESVRNPDTEEEEAEEPPPFFWAARGRRPRAELSICPNFSNFFCAK